MRKAFSMLEVGKQRKNKLDCFDDVGYGLAQQRRICIIVQDLRK